MSPLVTVVIPTANRPKYLPRAVESALAGLDAQDVEVIVVPNGPDETWREAMLSFKNSSSVRVVCSKEANANIARNVGLEAARGEYVRFLDDDDYLFSDGALKQYELIEASRADVVSGSIQLVDESGREFDIWRQPNVDDLCVGVLGPWRRCIPVGHVYRRSSLEGIWWRPDTHVRQDVEWQFNLCADREMHWEKIDDVVGVWQHHWGQRVSSATEYGEIRKLTAHMLLEAYQTLVAAERMTDERRVAVIQGLWGCVHAAFFLEPRYWSQIAHTINNIDSTVRPVLGLYNFPVLRNVDPITLLWIMLPKRWASYHVRSLLKILRLRHHW
jgi:glycosyltransferase involved in cell wall biosynthesis